MTMPNQLRLAELDILRGFAVAVMILAVSPGNWEFTYVPLQHAHWHGWRFVDLVFPDFLFGVGMAMGLTFGRSMVDGKTSISFWTKVVRRVIGLFLLGLALNSIYLIAHQLGAPLIRPDEPATIRVMGVLQRIALCILLAIGIVAATARKDKASFWRPNLTAICTAIAFILITYWVLLSFVPVPGHGAGQLDQEGNLAAYIDRLVITPPYMWPLGSVEWSGPVVYEPEGLLSTLPATANVLFGVLAISIWQSQSKALLMKLLLVGAALIAAGLFLDPLFPINKKIWTSSFALLTSGISFFALLIAIALMRAPLGRYLATPFKILGSNALLAFALSVTLSAIGSVPLTSGERPKNLQNFGMEFAQYFINDPHLASLTCALGVLILILLIILPLNRRGIYLRI